MKVTLTSPAEGKQPGATIETSDDRGRWLVQNGYATPDGGNDEDFGRTATNVEPDADPTLAENREAPGEDIQKTPKPPAPKKTTAKEPDLGDEPTK